MVLLPHYVGWLTNANPEIQAIGAGFLKSIGPKARVAVPELLKAADSTNWHVANAAGLALWSIDRQTNIALRVHTRQLQDTNHTCRELALIYLEKMGPAAVDAAPMIEPLLRDPDSTVRAYAEKALRAIDPAFLELSQHRINETGATNLARASQMLREGDYPQRIRALEIIALYGPSAKAAVPALIEALDGFSPDVSGSLASWAKMKSQRAAAEALAEIGSEAEAAVPALAARVWMGSYFQTSFCKALGRIGPRAQEAVPVLERALVDEKPQVRLAAADALTRIEPNHCSNAVVVLRALQHDPNLATQWRVDHATASATATINYDNPTCRRYRLSAAVPLWKLHLEPESPVPALVEELGKPENALAIWCVELLGDLGPEARSALPKLAALVGPDNGLRRAAAIAIRKIDPQEAERLNLPGVLAVP